MPNVIPVYSTIPVSLVIPAKAGIQNRVHPVYTGAGIKAPPPSFLPILVIPAKAGIHINFFTYLVLEFNWLADNQYFSLLVE
jgi:hypothetical protein